MDATVTLKLTPQEFDHVRRGLKIARDEELRKIDRKRDTDGSELGGPMIRAARAHVAEYGNLIERLS